MKNPNIHVGNPIKPECHFSVEKRNTIGRDSIIVNHMTQIIPFIQDPELLIGQDQKEKQRPGL